MERRGMRRALGVGAIVVAVCLLASVGALAKSRAGLQDDADALRTERDGLQIQLDQERSQNSSLSDQNRSLASSVSDAQVALAGANSQIEDLKRRYNKLVALVQLYVSTPTYTPIYHPVYCTSNTLGSYVYTTCS